MAKEFPPGDKLCVCVSHNYLAVAVPTNSGPMDPPFPADDSCSPMEYPESSMYRPRPLQTLFAD